MKKYFVKYLPVEGEIKEGDLFLHTCSAGSSKFLMKCKSVDSFGDIWQEKHDQGFPPQRVALYKQDCQKVKLFLCSRDNSEYRQEILTKGIKENQEFTEKEKDFLTLL